MKKFEAYKKRAEERFAKTGFLPRPLNAEEVQEFFEIISENNEIETLFLGKSYKLAELLVNIVKNEVLRGTFPECYKKAEYLYKFIKGEKISPYLSQKDALETLIDMKGGAATPYLVKLSKENIERKRIFDALEETVLINIEDFNELTAMAETEEDAKKLVIKIAEKSFAKKWVLKNEYVGIGIKAGDFISTDHLSPGKHANSRTDKPLHASYIMDGRPDQTDFMDRLKKLKNKHNTVYIVGGEGFGEGSSRKSATYTVLQVIGERISGEPENKQGGAVIAKSIAPIFRNSLVSSAVLPVICNTDEINEGDMIKIDVENSKVIINGTKEIGFQKINSLDLEKIKAGGVNNFAAGKELQNMAIEYCLKKGWDFDKSNMPEKLEEEKERVPMNLAQKIVAYNRIDGKSTIRTGEEAEVRVRGVFSQDTTGPMTMEEYQTMAGGMQFGAQYVIQSLCHTCEAPTSEERNRQKYLVDFVKKRGGVGLRPGEGVIHTIGNRFSAPLDIIVGGDSHTRTPRGIAFPGASDIVASCMKYGKMDMTMEPVVKVVFKGELQPGMTARDMVSMLVTEAEKQGFGKGIYTGKVIEMYGAEKLTAEEKYILTNAVAERSASAGLIPSNENTVKEIIDDLEYLKKRPDAETSISVINQVKCFEEYLKNPLFLRADEDAEYDAVIEIDMTQYKEPLIAKPHHPDNVVTLSEIAGIEIDEAYIGSCVGGEFESISMAAKVLEGKKAAEKVNLVISPAAEDITAKLSESGDIKRLTEANGIIIMSTCGLCMGNKRRIGSNSTAITTTTRNYQGRLGPSESGTYLGSSLVTACSAVLGRFPTIEEYMSMVLKK